MIVIPGVCGFCTWSPRLDDIGNSVRGVHFCKLIAKHFSFHTFAPLVAKEGSDDYKEQQEQQQQQEEQKEQKAPAPLPAPGNFTILILHFCIFYIFLQL